MIKNEFVAPKYITKNLILREVEMSDALDFFSYACRDDVGPTAGWKPHRSISDTKAIIAMFRQKKYENQLPTLAITLKETGEMIGTLELHSYESGYKAELGYSLNPLYQGKGYATEASFKALEWGFDRLGLSRIECSMYITNIKSKHICERLHMTFEGIKKKGYKLYDGSLHDIYCYAITDDEYYSVEYQTFLKGEKENYGL